MILLSHPTGNEFVRQAALAFREAKLLGEFWTCLNWNPASAPGWLPNALRLQFARRSFPESLRAVTHTVPLRESARLLSGVLGIQAFSKHETGLLSLDAVYQELDRKVSARVKEALELRMIYAYEDGALESFRAAKELGLQRVYDLPIGYWKVARQIYEEERELEPEWAVTLSGALDSSEKLARKDEELALANRIVVASSFTRQTLKAAQVGGTISVLSYGAPASLPVEPQHRSAAKLRVLYAGSLGQRKGLSYLLGAIERLAGHVELTLLGQKVTAHCAPLERATRRHHWIASLPHDQLLAEMRRHDVLVLPSLFEGFGLVLLEAMAQGLPVITTPHTAGPDFISEGVDGFVVPIRSVEAIAEKLELFVSESGLLREMKHAAWRKAATRNWQTYRESLVQLAREVMIKDSL